MHLYLFINLIDAICTIPFNIRVRICGTSEDMGSGGVANYFPKFVWQWPDQLAIASGRRVASCSTRRKVLVVPGFLAWRGGGGLAGTSFVRSGHGDKRKLQIQTIKVSYAVFIATVPRWPWQNCLLTECWQIWRNSGQANTTKTSRIKEKTRRGGFAQVKRWSFYLLTMLWWCDRWMRSILFVVFEEFHEIDPGCTELRVA